MFLSKNKVQNYHFSSLFGLFFSILISFSAKTQLLNEKGQSIALSKVKKNAVVIFFSLECPICEKYTQTLNKIDSLTEIPIYMVLLDRSQSIEDIKTYKKTYFSQQTFLIDKHKKLLKKLEATVTPEAFVLDTHGHIIYKGAIDNWFVDLGKSMTKPTENYLIDAIKALKNNQALKLKATKAIGCDI
jgi:protein-disulfide isomerase